jgi:hypothetical protein
MLVLWIAMGLAALYVAAAALGPVTNYDSGLYHLGAIRYASEFPTVPGLANIYFPFGYGNAEFPLGALLTSGPWGAEGFRLLNGLAMTLVALELTIRSGHRKLSPAFFILAVGLTASWVPMIALADYWVTSPTQDSSVLFVTLVAVAYLADAVRGRRLWVADAAVAVVLAVLLVLLRPTMGAFAAALVLVIAVRSWRRPALGAPRWRITLAAVVAVTLTAGVAASFRDYLLSGWLLYPLSVLSFDVPWRAPDPVFNRTATLGFHRDPDTLWEAAQGWDWIDAWVSRLPTQWETYLLIMGVLVAAVLVVLAARSSVHQAWWRVMVASGLPSAFMVVVWWVVTPPSFRFAWGPLFTLVAVPIGCSLWVLLKSPGLRYRSQSGMIVVILACSGPIVLVTGYSVAARFDSAAITSKRTWGPGLPYAVAAVPEPNVAPRELPSGLVIQAPLEGEQCWDRWPLCTPQVDPTVRLRGPALVDGLLP